jgi:hypothetical protein
MPRVGDEDRAIGIHRARRDMVRPRRARVERELPDDPKGLEIERENGPLPRRMEHAVRAASCNPAEHASSVSEP